MSFVTFERGRLNMRKMLTIAVVAVALVLPATAAFADGTWQSANIITVTAESNGKSATYSEVVPDGGVGVTFYELLIPEMLEQDGMPLGTIETLQAGFQADPQIDLAFSLVNTSAFPTTYTITTATIAFAGIGNAQAVASASLTATNGAGSPAGVSTTGGYMGGTKSYQARYSSTTPANSATVFANLVANLSASLGASDTEMSPLVGTTNIGTVYMMESEYKFTLSAGDQASGTSTFVIVPEPGSLLMLLVGGAFAIRRRLSA